MTTLGLASGLGGYSCGQRFPVKGLEGTAWLQVRKGHGSDGFLGLIQGLGPRHEPRLKKDS